jgi:hypothetical protein
MTLIFAQTSVTIPDKTMEKENQDIIPVNTALPTGPQVLSNGRADKFNIRELTDNGISPPGYLDATDCPNDAGGNIFLKFTASANHPGMSGELYDSLEINYYLVYRNAESSSISDAVHWATIRATPIPAGKDDTIRAVISTRGDNRSAYYWVTAFKGRVLFPIMAKSAAEEAVPCETATNMTILTNDGGLMSPLSPGNKAISINNKAATKLNGADFNADGIVDILDIGVMLDYLNDDDEFDVVFDLKVDGSINVFDIGKILDVFSTSVSDGQPIADNGINTNSVVTFESDVDNNSGKLTLSITARQIEGIVGYQFTVFYDNKNYEFNSIKEGSFLSEDKDNNSLFIYNDKNAGTVSVVGIIIDEDIAEGSGILATLGFNRIGDELSEIVVDNIKLMDSNQRINILEQLIYESPPTTFNLEQNYPNPFNGETCIKYEIPKNANVKIIIYNVLGYEIKTLIDDIWFKDLEEF